VLRPEPGKPLRVRMAETTQALHRDLPPTTLWTYGGHYPGPTIEARRGHAFDVVWEGRSPIKPDPYLTSYGFAEFWLDGEPA